MGFLLEELGIKAEIREVSFNPFQGFGGVSAGPKIVTPCGSEGVSIPFRVLVGFLLY